MEVGWGCWKQRGDYGLRCTCGWGMSLGEPGSWVDWGQHGGPGGQDGRVDEGFW